MIKNKRPKIALLVLAVILSLLIISFSLLTFAQDSSNGFSKGRTSPSGYTIVAGAVGTLGEKGNSSTYNLTIIAASTPVGTGNNTNYNVSLGYIYALDLNHSPTNVTIKLNKSIDDIKINDVINVTANVTGDNNLAFGWIVDNITGTNRNYTYALSGTQDFFSQNITINVSSGNVINFTAFVNDTISIVTQSNSILVTVKATEAEDTTN